MNKRLFIICIITTVLLFSGCSNAPKSSGASSTNTSAMSQTSDVGLSGHTLTVFCGAGLKEPFQKIADAFSKKTGCKVEATYGNAAQIQTQIKTAKEGDLLVAGAAEEVKPVQESVTKSKDLVKHIPVLVVQKGNPMKITGLADLTKSGVRVLLGDAKSTPIGKLADKALTDMGILNKVNVLARTTTAPAITTALAAGECDAAIVWKENAKNDKVEIVDTKDLDPYVKVVPVVALSFNKDSKALDEFLAYLDSDEAKQIWIASGYQTLN